MATPSKGKSQQTDQSAKVKLMLVSGVLLVAVGWLIYYGMSNLRGRRAAPAQTAAEAAAAEEKHATELKQVEEQAERSRGGRPAPPPAGS